MDLESERARTRLSWRGTGRSESQISSQGVVLGVLSYDRTSVARFTASSSGKSWTFARAGLLAPRIVVQDGDSNAPAATLALAWRGGGVITMPDGGAVRLSPKGFWRSQWTLTDPEGETILTIKPDFGRGEPTAAVEAEPSQSMSRMIPLLTAVCWYAILLASYEAVNDEAAVVASMTAISI
jgi:hypothetical protein